MKVVNSVKLEVYELNLELAQSELEKQQSLYEKGRSNLKDLKGCRIKPCKRPGMLLKMPGSRLKKMKVVSPFDGVITSLPISPRDHWLKQGQPLPGSWITRPCTSMSTFLKNTAPEINKPDGKNNKLCHYRKILSPVQLPTLSCNQPESRTSRAVSASTTLNCRSQNVRQKLIS
ncbi:MAG: hypothetical protein R2727_01060 [Bacteroidales bacterium]